MALEDSPASRRQPPAMLLQAALYRHVITQNLSAEAGCVATTRALLLRRSSVLGEGN